MNVIDIPFNKFLGMHRAEKGSGFILKLDDRKEYLNHLGTIHASALFGLAEATSGEFLLNQFGEYNLNIIPVVRHVDVKYNKPGMGQMFSKAEFAEGNVENIISELSSKKRVAIQVKVEIFNVNTEKVMTAVFDWFLVSN